MDDWTKKKTEENCADLVNTILIVKSGATSIAKKVSIVKANFNYDTILESR